MTIATRIIPTLLSRRGTLVKGRRFDHGRVIGHVRQAARVYEARGVDELILLDVTATVEGRGPDLGLVRDIAGECFMPLTVGGGVRNVEDVRALLANGADKVVLCTAALERPEVIHESAHRFGSQAVVLAVDVLDGEVVSHCGRLLAGIGPLDHARRGQSLGAGELLLTAVSRDGTMNGYDLDLIESVAASVSIPVVASGGCGSYEHMAEALRAGAHAVAAGAMFQFTDATPKGAARYLADKGFNMRVAA